MTKSKNSGMARDGSSPLLLVMLFAFVLAVLAYLAAIDRYSWWQLRPASGSAAAMAKAGSPPQP